MQEKDGEDNTRNRLTRIAWSYQKPPRLRVEWRTRSLVARDQTFAGHKLHSATPLGFAPFRVERACSLPIHCSPHHVVVAVLHPYCLRDGETGEDPWRELRFVAAPNDLELVDVKKPLRSLAPTLSWCSSTFLELVEVPGHVEVGPVVDSASLVHAVAAMK